MIEFMQLVSSTNSMTENLLHLGNDLRVKLIYDGVRDDKYCRDIILYLDNTPVIIASSTTNLDNQYFVNILKNANTTPIGKFLFNPKYNIAREDMQVLAIDGAKPIELPYHYNPLDNGLFLRISRFTYANETFELKEVVLKSLKKYYE